jgi:hypothetical protein
VTTRKLFAIIFAALFLSALAAAQQPDGSTAFCTFEDGKEISVRYQQLDFSKKTDPPVGRPWSPNGVPIFLFTPTELTLGNYTIPTGAYSLYTVKNRNDWTIIINKNVTQGSPYDDKQDLARATMETTKLSAANKPLAVTIGHISPKVCSLQIVFGDTGAWAEFKEK